MVVAIFFTGSGCPACLRQKPAIKQLQQEGYSIDIVNIDQETELAEQYQIKKLPTIVILQDGQEIKRFVGVTSIEILRTNLKKSTPDYKIW